MECCRFYTTNTNVRVGFPVLPSVSHRRPIISLALRGPSVVRCGPPLEPRTLAGKLLSGVVLYGGDDFHVAAGKELERLAAHREEAAALLELSPGSPEASLHRRIAELKKKECRDEIEDVIYMLVFRKFAEMKVHLIPSLSKCNIYGRRLEIWPSKDCELESVHSFEVLEMVREHLSASLGLKRDNWMGSAQIERLKLYKLYSAWVLYGYFLKSASFRYNLELSLGPSTADLEKTTSSCLQIPISEVMSLASEYMAYGCINERSPASTSQASPRTLNRERENLRDYVMGMDQEMIQMCARPKSKEALRIIERHSSALFGEDENTCSVDLADDLILTSFASLKRFLLEAVAFGSFLWDTEKHVNGVYMLEDNC